MNSPENPDKSKEELLEELERLRDTLEALEARDPVQELAVSEARYRALVEGSSDFIYVLDSEGHFTFANSQVDNLLGYSRENIIGKHYSDILHPSNVENLGHAFAERRTGDRATRRMEIRLRSSTRRWPTDGVTRMASTAGRREPFFRFTRARRINRFIGPA